MDGFLVMEIPAVQLLRQLTCFFFYKINIKFPFLVYILERRIYLLLELSKGSLGD